MEQWVGLLDCNNFFVSCERLFRPDLEGKPVAVLSSNDGCIVARSKEVKDIGIPMGVPYFKIKDIIKTENITLFSGNHTLYKDISKRVFEAMRTVLEDIEQYSVDEAFFVVIGTEAEVLEKANLVKDTVEQIVGVPVSVGVARSKTLAKIANDVAKKTSGTFVLSDETWLERRSEVALSEVWGIGANLGRRFREHNLLTVQDLLTADSSRIKQLFGIIGMRLKEELSGEVFTTRKRSSEAQKSLMSSRTFKESTENIAVLYKALAHHINSVAENLRVAGLKTNYLRVYISPSRFGDFALQNGSKEVYFNTPTNVTSELLKAGNQLLQGLFKEGVPYKKLGVVTGNLVSSNVIQLGMFDMVEQSDTKELQDVIDAINKTAKGGKIQLGTTVSDDTWKPRSDLRSPSYTTKWTDLAIVKA